MMNKNTMVVAVFVILLLIGAGFLYFNYGPDSVKEVAIPLSSPDISMLKGCYVAKLSKDAYTLDIESADKGMVSGLLAFNNFEKDSSSGTLNGTFMNGILLGNYSFDSEGMHSYRQVIFKKVGDDFIEGFGEVKMVGDKEIFVDPTKITYDLKVKFVKSINCK